MQSTDSNAPQLTGSDLFGQPDRGIAEGNSILANSGSKPRANPPTRWRLTRTTIFLASAMLLLLTGTASWFWYDHASVPTLSETEIMVTMADGENTGAVPQSISAPAVSGSAPAVASASKQDFPAANHADQTGTLAGVPVVAAAAAPAASDDTQTTVRTPLADISTTPHVAMPLPEVHSDPATSATASAQSPPSARLEQPKTIGPLAAVSNIASAGSKQKAVLAEKSPQKQDQAKLSSAAPLLRSTQVRGSTTPEKRSQVLAAKSTKKRQEPGDAELRRPTLAQQKPAGRTNGPRLASATGKNTSTGKKIANPARISSASARVRDKATGKDINLHAAMIRQGNSGERIAARMNTSSASFAQGSGRDMLRRKTGEPLAAIVGRCAQLSKTEAKSCRARICQGQWKNERACK